MCTVVVWDQKIIKRQEKTKKKTVKPRTRLRPPFSVSTLVSRMKTQDHGLEITCLNCIDNDLIHEAEYHRRLYVQSPVA